MVHTFLYPDIMCRGSFTDDITCIYCTHRFYQKNLTLLCSNRLVFQSFWYNKQFTFIQKNLPIAELNFQLTFQNNENFIGFRMSVPDKFPFYLDNLEMI